MSTSRSLVWLKRLFWMSLAVAGSVAITGYVRWTNALDPFARYRATQDAAEANRVGIRLQDVKLTTWTDGKESMRCDIGRVDVRRDHQNLDFYDVTDGQYRTQDGLFRFEGPKANYSAGFQLLQVSSGARVWNKDIDLRAEGIQYRQKVKRLQTQGAVRGKLFGGQIIAKTFTYFAETKDFEATDVLWEGKLNKELQEVSPQESSKPWKIKGATAKRQGDRDVFTNGEATDDEIIVMAPNIERNVKTDVVTATGGVRYFSKKADMICDKAVIYRKEKRAVLTGNVTMRIKPEDQEKLEVTTVQPFRPLVPEEVAAARPPAPPTKTEEQKRQDEELRSTRTARKYPISLTAQTVEYWYKRGERKAAITGNPQARQDFPNGRWRHLWTYKGFYDAEAETLRMESSAGKKDTRVVTSVGDDFVATWFKSSTKEEGEDDWEGEAVEGVFISDDDELNNRNNLPPRIGTPPPALRGPIGGRRRA